MPTIYCHHDADGICSAHFVALVTPDAKIKVVDEFGSTKGWEKGDIMVDMRPNNPNIEGLVIDHHLPHPEPHKYELISDVVPASLITWRLYKDKIPKEEWWKLAIGVMGDGQPELIPIEIYEECPSLLKNVKTSIYQSYGKWNINMMPLYKLLSSSINSFLRKGEYDSALNLLKYSESPMDIYSSEDTRISKADVRNEFTASVKDADIFDYDNLAVIIFYSKYRMSGYIGSSLQSSLNHKTIMAINKRDGSVSLRGDLATYYKNKLKDIDYLEIDGHAGFMGGKLKKNYHTLIKDLNSIL